MNQLLENKLKKIRKKIVNESFKLCKKKWINDKKFLLRDIGYTLAEKIIDPLISTDDRIEILDENNICLDPTYFKSFKAGLVRLSTEWIRGYADITQKEIFSDLCFYLRYKNISLFNLVQNEEKTVIDIKQYQVYETSTDFGDLKLHGKEIVIKDKGASILKICCGDIPFYFSTESKISKKLKEV